MIKINLLPGYIREGRRVKALLRLLVVVLVIEAALLSAYVWAPAPFSLTSQEQKAERRRQKSYQEFTIVQQTEQEANMVQQSFAAKQSWVTWVEDADRVPELWVRWFRLVNKYIPNDVVINGLPMPSGNVLSLSGTTSDYRAASRWYLNMLRCEVVEQNPSAVSFSTATVGWPGEYPTAANPKMATQVSISVRLLPEAIPVGMVPAPPADAGVGGGAARGGGMMGGRMGGGGGMGGGRMGGGGAAGMGGGRMGGGGPGGMRGGGAAGGGPGGARGAGGPAMMRMRGG